MKNLLTFLLAILLVSAAIPVSLAQTQKSQPGTGHVTDPRFFPLKDIKPGMKGTAKTIFQGDTPEEFGFDVLGVIDGYPNPKQQIVLIKLTGALADRTGIFQGMSGSPAYIDGKLVGAIAYGFSFSKEPIGGITPIEQMIDIFKDNSDSAAPVSTPVSEAHKKYSFNDLVAVSNTPNQQAGMTSLPSTPSTMIGGEYAAVPSLAPTLDKL